MFKFSICFLLFLITSCNSLFAQWYELGGNNSLAANGAVSSICSDTSGNVYAAGQFTNYPTVPIGCAYVAKYNGSNWTELGGLNALGSLNNPGPSNIVIESICTDKYGNVYAAGTLRNSSGNFFVAKYDGMNWTELGGANSIGIDYQFINSICTDKYGNIYAAGGFYDSSGYPQVAKYNGSNWSRIPSCNPLLSPNKDSVYHSAEFWVCTDTFGNLYYAGGLLKNNNHYFVAKWDGISWLEVGGTGALAANSGITTICCDLVGNLYAGGGFTNGINAGVGHEYVAKYNGSNWSELGGYNSLAANSFIGGISCDKLGNVYAAGNFTNGISHNTGHEYVAKYNGVNWSELGGYNNLAANSFIYTVHADWQGNIYAGGNFGKTYLTNKYVAAFAHCTGGVSYATQYGVICPTDTFYFNQKKLTAAGVYKDTFQTNKGCDSVITLHLQVVNPSSAIINAQICWGSSYNFDGQVLHSAGVYQDTLTNYVGCDSVVVLYLSMSAINIVHDTFCSAMVYPFHGSQIYHSVAGDYTDSVPTANCDTLFVGFFHVRSSSELDTTVFICSYRATIFNDSAYASPGYHYIHLNNHIGCDSLIKLTLYVYPSAFVSYYLSGDSVICTVPNIQYQWIDCATKQPIAGETHRYYIPTQTGAYAVIATDSICIDTSSCYYIVFSGIGNGLALQHNELNVYPNPANSELRIRNDELRIEKVEIENVLGQVVLHPLISSSSNLLINVVNLPSGIYFLKATDESGLIHVAKFVKE